MKRSAMVSKRSKAMTIVEPSRSLRAPLTKARAGLSGAKKKTARLIAKNPFRIVAGALAFGFVFAKLKTIF